jgi:Flp pilus assembly protein TadD
MRMRLGRCDPARAAYQSALAAYQQAQADAAGPEAWMQQAYVLALLGRVEDGRAALAKAQKKFPGHPAVRDFTEGGRFDRMIADPAFKEIAP